MGNGKEAREFLPLRFGIRSEMLPPNVANHLLSLSRTQLIPVREKGSVMALILIADDEPFQRFFVRETLAARPEHTIIEAEDGKQTLQSIYERRPDLVVLDLKMPVIDGLEVCRQVKADPALQSTLVVLVTANPDETTGRLAGCDEYVVKPYEMDKLEGVIDKLLGRSHLD